MILNEYLASVGGKEAIIAAYEEKKAAIEASKKGKKRGRVSTGTPQNGGKKSKKNGTGAHPAVGSPPASSEKKFVPPTGNWEDLIESIEACEGEDEKVIVYLTWKVGAKTQHPLAQIYKRCPQRMLRFYESHLWVFSLHFRTPLIFQVGSSRRIQAVRMPTLNNNHLTSSDSLPDKPFPIHLTFLTESHEYTRMTTFLQSISKCGSGRSMVCCGCYGGLK
jgi:hypothetical protein